MVASSTVCVGFMMRTAFLEKEEARWCGNVACPRDGYSENVHRSIKWIALLGNTAYV